MVRPQLNRKESEELAARVAHKYKNDFKGDKKKTLSFFLKEGFKRVTIKRWIRKVEESGSCEFKVQRGPDKTIKTRENMRRVAEIRKDNPSISVRELARKLDMPRTTVSKMLNQFRNKVLTFQPDPVKGPGPGLSHLPLGSPIRDVEFAFDDDDDGGSETQVERDSSCSLRSCFLCNVENAQELDFNLTPSCRQTPEDLGPTEVERSLKVICFLKNVLGMRGVDIAILLEETGGTSPSEWGISLCTDPGCKGPVQRAFDIWMEIKKLESELRKKREAILERLRSHMAGEEIEDDRVFLRERVREVIKEARCHANTNTKTDLIEPQVKMEIEVDNFSNAEDICDNDTGWDGSLDEHFQESEIKIESSCETLRRRSSRRKRSITKFRPDVPSPKKSCRGSPKKVQKTRMKSKLKKVKSQSDGHLVSSGSEEMIYSCHVCPSLGNMDIDKFIAHISFHSMHPQKCTVCSSYFPGDVSVEEVQKHWETRHPIAQSIAPKVTQVSAVDAAGKIWLCSRPKCKATFGSAEERDNHELTVHGIEDSAKGKFNCTHCPSNLRNVKELRLHKAMEHPEEAVVSCCYCDTKLAIQSDKDSVKFLNLDELKQHISVAHPDRRGTDIGKKPRFLQTCHVCGAVLQGTDYSKLDSHIARKHGQKLYETYTCPICSKKMRYADAWKHTVRHWPDAPRKYICQFCGKGFVRQETRLNHEKIHKNHKTRPYQCELCGSSFAVSTYLAVHRKVTHQGHVWPSVLRKRKAARIKSLSSSHEKPKTGHDTEDRSEDGH